MAKANLTQRFMAEVIWAFADRDGAIPMRRGDVFVLARELGWSSKFADLVAYSPLTKLADEAPVSIEDARGMLVGSAAA